MKVVLHLPLTLFDRIHDALERDRRRHMISVDRAAITALLMDYSNLFWACEDAGIEIVDPPANGEIEPSLWESLPSTGRARARIAIGQSPRR